MKHHHQFGFLVNRNKFEPFIQQEMPYTPYAAQHLLFVCLILLVPFPSIPMVNGLAILPDFVTYKTCLYSAPSFSPGCMANVTANVGERATFNCQVKCYYYETKITNYDTDSIIILYHNYAILPFLIYHMLVY